MALVVFIYGPVCNSGIKRVWLWVESLQWHVYKQPTNYIVEIILDDLGNLLIQTVEGLNWHKPKVFYCVS